MSEFSIYDMKSMPESKFIEKVENLIAENRELREKVAGLERQRDWLAKFVASYVDCNQCPYSEDVCTPQAHVDCCSLISQKAKEAGE